MRNKRGFCVAFLAATGLVLAAGAGAEDLTERSRLAASIVSSWSDHVESTYGIEADLWARRMTATFEGASIGDLERAAAQSDFQAMSSALLGQSGGVVPLALGDPDSDLVFTPLLPCRIVDTRLVGGIIPTGESRNFMATTSDSFAGQGGIDGDCGIPEGISAVAISLSAARPVVEGFLTVHPANAPRPLAASLTFQGGLRNDTDGSVMTLCSGGSCDPEFTTYASAATNVVIDVTGYYAAPTASALDCVRVVDSGNLDLLGGLQPRSVACPVGRTATGGGCGGALGIGVSYSRPQVVAGSIAGWECGLIGSLLSILSYEVNAVCCRTPGG